MSSPSSSLLRTFLIGSSVAIFPYIYLGMAYNRLSCTQQESLKVNYTTMVMILPFLYGIVYTVLTILLKDRVKNPTIRLMVMGALAGEIYSLIGHFGLSIPETLLKSKNPNMVHLIAPILYTFIYGTYVNFLEKNIKY